MSFEEATFIEPVGCCLRALKKCNVQDRRFIGNNWCWSNWNNPRALSKIFGAEKTIVSDPIDYRLNVAKEFGADVAINPVKEDLTAVVKAETDGRGVDIAVVTAPSLEAYKAGLSVCRKGGKLCVFAPMILANICR